MKNYLISLFCVFFILNLTSLHGQRFLVAPPYQDPVDYVPIEAYLQIMKEDFERAERDRVRQIEEMKARAINVKKISSEYFDLFPKENIRNGWHQVEVMNNYNFCSPRKVYVENNRVTRYFVDDIFEVEVVMSLPYEKGRATIEIKSHTELFETGFLDVYFFDYLKGKETKNIPPLEPGNISLWTTNRPFEHFRTYLEIPFNNRLYWVELGRFKDSFRQGAEPDCNSEGTLNYKLKPGSYRLRVDARDNEYYFNFELEEGECLSFPISL